ncbi:nuclear transport factor 2 family protein [Spirosoma sp. KNUC1025]|uniref:nuclear transport factor 2 family protein n=1 Tax=Spirosoma sp. KNUC1025 TaxID=2894082 RepID=UPI00386E2B79|nr:nuclear transport factor 2 family protein [Spirosoma sp. KNUC1025]
MNTSLSKYTMLALLASLIIGNQYVRGQSNTYQQLVQQQIDGWNAHNAIQFAAPYSDTTTLYTFPDKVLARFKTHQELEEYYTKVFKENPNLHCEVANQMTVGSTVILHERISGWVNRPNFDTLVIYHFENSKIISVHFVRK